MKKIFVLTVLVSCSLFMYAQEMPKDTMPTFYFRSIIKEKDITKKRSLYDTFIKYTAKDTSSFTTGQKSMLLSSMAAAYQQVDSVKEYDYFASQMDPNRFAFSYFSFAKKLVEQNKNLSYAKKFALIALKGNKNSPQWKDLQTKGSLGTTDSAMHERLIHAYAPYPDLYAQTCYLTKDYKTGYPYAKEAAIDVAQGQDWEFNEHYALLVAKALPTAQAKTELERLVKTGMLTPKGKDALKEVYVKQNKTSKGYDKYLANLEKEVVSKGKASLEKVMVKKPVPDFILLDMDGNSTSLSSLKGKVVVIDFWATWCVPCIRAFPAMYKAKERFKNNPNVVFLFIDTKEPANTDVKGKVSKLIAKDEYKGYDFKILLDEGKKTADSFGVEGIPAKYVLDPNGNVRFSTMGYDGKEDALVEELSLMIEMAAEAK